MSPLAYAWRSLFRDRLRGLLGVAGVAAIGALLLDMLLLSRGLVISFRDLLESTGYDVRVTATDALPGLGPRLERATALAAELERLPEVEHALPLAFERARIQLADPELAATATVIAVPPRGSGQWELLAGSELGVEPQTCLVNPALARELGLAPGSTLRVGPRAALSFTALRVVGIASFPFDMRGEWTLALSNETFRAAGLGPDRDEADILLIRSRPGVAPERTLAALRTLRTDVHGFSIEQFLEVLRRNDFSYFRQIATVLASITCGFSFLLMTTLLSVSVSQRTGEIAALRALGLSRRRVAMDLVAESALFVALGAAVSLPAGLGVASLLDAILRDLPGLPERLHFFVVEPTSLFLHAGLLAASGALAACYPVWIVLRLPIATTLRNEVIS